MIKDWKAEFTASGADLLYTYCCEACEPEEKGEIFSACIEAMSRFNLHNSAGRRLARRFVLSRVDASRRIDNDERPPFVVDGELCKQQLSLQAWDNISEEDGQRIWLLRD